MLHRIPRILADISIEPCRYINGFIICIVVRRKAFPCNDVIMKCMISWHSIMIILSLWVYVLMKSYFGLYYFSQIDMVTVARIVLNTPRPNENGRRFANDIFKCNFLLMKIYRFRFHWCLFLMDQLTIFLGWFIWWLGSNQETSHYLNQWWLDSWRILASLGLN